MAAFEYTALDNGGRSRKGIVSGDSTRHVRSLLREQGLFPMEVHSIRDEKQAQQHRFLHYGISSADLALMTRQLATLVRAGMPLEQSLAALADQLENKSMCTVIAGVRTEITEGAPLHEALDRFPLVFPDLYRSMVEAGEASGRLEDVLDRLADYTEDRQLLKQKLATAMIYPALMTVVAIAVVTGLVTYVVPEIVQVFENTGQALPWATSVLITITNILRTRGLLIIAGMISFIAVTAYLVRHTRLRINWHRMLLRLPLAGRINRSVITARLARAMAILTESGVPLLETLQIASRMTGNLIVKEVLDNAYVRVREGERLHNALNVRGVFPPLFIHLLAAGEESGNLENMLDRAAVHQERELEMVLGAMLSLLEPLIIIMMGGIVLFIVLAILTPIFEMNQFIGN